MLNPSASASALHVGLNLRETTVSFSQRVSTRWLQLNLCRVCDVGPSGWGGTSPTSPSIDNGTAAWGKTTDAPSGWGDPDDAEGKTAGWGNPPPNPIQSG